MINKRCVMQLQTIILLSTKISWDLNVYNHEMLHIRTKKKNQTDKTNKTKTKTKTKTTCLFSLI